MLRYFIFLLLLFSLINLTAKAQDSDSLKNDRFSFHFQTTIINQFKPSFTADYAGENSLSTEKENATSLTGTLFAGAKLWKGASMFINPEIAGGSGISKVLGVAAAPNGETFRVGDPSPKIYLAKLFYRQLIALTHESTYQENGFNQLGEYKPNRFISFTIGKISIADYFDNNSYTHDARTQFICWALMSNGAWDYPANTRGYTPSFVLEYVTPSYEMRYGFSLVPLTANGNEMNWDISNASSQTIEFTKRYTLSKRPGTIRLLGFFTTANMGNYQESILLNPTNPDIEKTRKYGNIKYGFGLNIEQELTDNTGCFLRSSWNDGHTETWTFTEIDRAISLGFSSKGSKWKRDHDNIGIAYAGSGISTFHRNYLKAGGQGFMLGDGNLTYSWEHLGEVYYSAELVKDQIFFSGVYQLLINPGYNQDRKGPVNIFSIRLHARI